MKEKNNFFDIETTGLTAFDEIICFSYGGSQKIQTDMISEKDLLSELSMLVKTSPHGPVITFFGEPKYGTTQGFDMPMVRTRYIINDIADMYPFNGMKHIDLMEVAKKYFNTKRTQEPALELLSATQVVELTKQHGLFPLKTKEANIKQLRSELGTDAHEEFIRENIELKVVDDNSLDHIFKLFYSEDVPDEEYSGTDMPMLFKLYKASGDERYLKYILEHNRCCISKTKFLHKMLIESELVNILMIPMSRL